MVELPRSIRPLHMGVDVSFPRRLHPPPYGSDAARARPPAASEICYIGAVLRFRTTGRLVVVTAVAVASPACSAGGAPRSDAARGGASKNVEGRASRPAPTEAVEVEAEAAVESALRGDPEPATLALVPAHTIADAGLAERREDLTFFLEHLDKRGSNLGRLHLFVKAMVPLAITEGAPQAEVDRLVTLYLESFLGLMAVSKGHAFTIDGRRIQYPDVVDNDHGHVAHWMDAVALAIVFGRKETLERLLNVSFTDMDNTRTDVSPRREMLARALRSLLEDEWRPQHLRAALAIEASDDYGLVVETWARALGTVQAGDTAFCTNLQAHLEAHRTYWTSPRWQRDPQGLKSFLASALLKLASERTMSCSISSDYLVR